MIKYLHVFWVACFLFLLQESCREQPEYIHLMPRGDDSLAIAYTDSLLHYDPWFKYSYTERQGKRLFDHYCTICHGSNGEGDGFNAYNLDPRPHSLRDSAYMKSLSDKSLSEIIAFGGGYVNKSVLMPAYQNTIGKEQVTNLIAYIRTFTKNRLGQ